MRPSVDREMTAEDVEVGIRAIEGGLLDDCPWDDSGCFLAAARERLEALLVGVDVRKSSKGERTYVAPEFFDAYWARRARLGGPK